MTATQQKLDKQMRLAFLAAHAARCAEINPPHNAIWQQYAGFCSVQDILSVNGKASNGKAHAGIHVM